jgi:hypothetical protein
VVRAELADTREATERWFVRAGLPHLIRDYSVREDILTRALPVLVLVFLVEILLAGDLEWRWWQNALALLGAVAIVLMVTAASNNLRGRRPFALPDSVGAVELGVFLLVPPLLRLAFGDDPVQGLLTFGANVVILALVYLVTSYGVLPTVVWALKQLVTQIRSVGTLLARSLPLLLLVTMFMFFNAELWKVVDDLPPGFLAVAIGILVLAGSSFVLLFQRTEIDEIGRFDWWSDVRSKVDGTPVADIDVSSLPDPPNVEPLERRGRVNVGVLLYFMQATQIAAVTLAVTVFYVVFGLFTIQESTIVQWTGSDVVEDVVHTDLWGSQLALTGELLRTALFVGAIAGLQFTVTALTDQQYRQQFSREVTSGLRRAMAVRAIYLVRVAPREKQSAAPT